MKMSHRVTRFVLSLSLPLFLAACSNGGGGGAKPAYFGEGMTSLDATVEAINHSTREVTLKGDGGNTMTFTVDERVKNLDKVAVGDRVRADYYESVDVHVRAPGEKGAEPAPASAGATLWDEPGAVIRERATITATVKKVDRKKGRIDLRGPAGNVRSFVVRDARDLQNVNVGDEVVATVTEALAVGIDPVKR